MLQHVFHARVVRLGPRDDDAVGRTCLHDVAHRLHGIVAPRIGRDDEVIGRIGQHFRYAVDQVGTEAGDLLLGVQDQADDVGLAGPEPHAGTVRAIADLLGHELHAPARFLADFGRVLQRPRHGGDAESGHEGDRLQRRALAGGRVHARVPFPTPMPPIAHLSVGATGKNNKLQRYRWKPSSREQGGSAGKAGLQSAIEAG